MPATEAPEGKPKTAAPTVTVEQIEETLHLLLTLAEQNEAERERTLPCKPMTFLDFTKEFAPADPGDAIVNDPIGQLCREGTRTLGETLAKLLPSTEKRSEVLERVASRNPEKYMRRASYLDHRWNGIENWWS